MTYASYSLGDYSLVPWRQLCFDGSPIAVGGKALDLLSVLAKSDGNLVTKDELLAAVWPGVIVEENAIQVQVSAARKALGAEARRLITVHGRGYRLEVDRESNAPRPAATVQTPTVMVARFTTVADDPDASLFAAGLSEDIAGALARVRALSVTSFRPDVQDEQTYESVGPGGQARAQYLLQGMVDTANTWIRIRLKLINVHDGIQIWGDKFDYPLSDKFALQDEVALRVAAAVEPAIEIVEARRILRDKTDLLGSYELYMQGWARVFAYTQDDLLEGIALMERAIAIAPDFGVALAGAGISHHDVYVLGWGSDPAFHRQRAMAHLERALRIGEDDANILAWVACSLPILSGNVPRAAALVERALHVNPSSANAWFVSGYIHQCRGRFAEAIADFETAQRLAPFGFNSSFARLLVGSCQGAMGEFAMAIETVEAAGHPGPWPDIYLSTYNAELGRVEPALAAMERVRLFGVRPLAELSAMTPPGSRPTLPLGALFRIEREVAKSQGLS